MKTKDRFSVTGMRGEDEIRISLDVLCEHLFPAQQGWGDEMATAIDNLHHHKAAIMRAVLTQAALFDTLQRIRNRLETLCHIYANEAHVCQLHDLLEMTRAAIAKATSQDA